MSQPISAVPRCTACGSARIVKNGHNARGSQQFLCKACGARRVLAPKRARETSAARRAEARRAVGSERF